MKFDGWRFWREVRKHLYATGGYYELKPYQRQLFAYAEGAERYMPKRTIVHSHTGRFKAKGVDNPFTKSIVQRDLADAEHRVMNWYLNDYMKGKKMTTKELRIKVAELEQKVTSLGDQLYEAKRAAKVAEAKAAYEKQLYEIEKHGKYYAMPGVRDNRLVYVVYERIAETNLKMYSGWGTTEIHEYYTGVEECFYCATMPEVHSFVATLRAGAINIA